MLKFIDYMMDYKEDRSTKEDLQRTLSYYIKEMSAKEERIRNQKHKYEKIINDMNHKYQLLENKYKRLKSRKA